MLSTEQEQERTRLLENVCKPMDKTQEMMSQHVKDICWMKLKLLWVKGKAAVRSHEAIALQDMIQQDHDTFNWLLPIVQELKSYTNQLGQIKVLRERLCSMDLWINKLQMRPSMHVLEDHLVRLEDRLQDQHKEIAIL